MPRFFPEIVVFSVRYYLNFYTGKTVKFLHFKVFQKSVKKIQDSLNSDRNEGIFT